jgi:endonuclease IV
MCTCSSKAPMLLCLSVCHAHACTPGAVQEKATRGALKSAVERAISKKTIVILDSLNNIKVS